MSCQSIPTQLPEHVVNVFRIILKPEDWAPYMQLVKLLAKKHDDMRIVDDMLPRKGQDSFTAIKSQPMSPL